VIAHLAIFGGDLLRYLLLCVLCVASGMGLMRLIRLSLPLHLALVLAPMLTLAFWSVGLGIGVAWRVPVRSLAGPLWALTIVLALYWLSRIGALNKAPLGAPAHHSLRFPAIAPEPPVAARQPPWRSLVVDSWPLLVCMLLPVVVMFAYFRAGLANYPGSILPDGWSYIAYGQYLWQYPRGADGGLAPLYQYAAHLSQTRFTASALLGVLSPIFTSGDTQSASGLFLAWGLFTFAASCAFFGRAFGLSAVQLVAYLFLTIVAGWIYNLLWANNYDNLLALAFFPALIGAIAVLTPQSWAWRLVLGLLGAGLLYAYPELAVVILGGAMLVLAERCWAERKVAKSWLWFVVCALGITIALIAPFLREMYAFIINQAASGLNSGPKPGTGMFAGLLSLRFQPAAFWGLGGEYALEQWASVRNVIGYLLAGLAAFGVVRLLQQRKIGFVATIAMLLSACAILIVVQAYSYGAYKMILLGWWCFTIPIILGLDSVAAWVHERARPAATGGLYALAILLTVAFNRSGASAPGMQSSKYEHLEIAQFRTLEQIKQLPDVTQLVIGVDDWLANEWAVYFLRDTPIHLDDYRMYMAQPHVISFMERAQVVPLETTRYILTDDEFEAAPGTDPAWKLAWSGGPYRLWDTAGNLWARIIKINNANGIEQLDGHQFFWIGQGDTTVDIAASEAGILRIRATYLPGPSVPNQPQRNLLVTSSAGYSEQVTLNGGFQEIVLPVPAGDTTIILRPLDKPISTSAATGDPRPLVLGVKAISVQLDRGLAAIKQIENANGLEQVDGTQFFWIGQGPTKIEMYAIQDGHLTLEATFVPGPSLPDAAVRQILIETNSGYREHISIAGGAQRIELPVQAGNTTITLTPLDVPTSAATNADPRPLLLGVKGLTVHLDL
jgi:hypothetical protein